MLKLFSAKQKILIVYSANLIKMTWNIMRNVRKLLSNKVIFFYPERLKMKREEMKKKKNIYKWLINLSVGFFLILFSYFSYVDVLFSPLPEMNIWDELRIIGLSWKHTFCEDYGWLARLEFWEESRDFYRIRYVVCFTIITKSSNNVNCKVIKIIVDLTSKMETKQKMCSAKRSLTPPYHL